MNKRSETRRKKYVKITKEIPKGRMNKIRGEKRGGGGRSRRKVREIKS